MEAVLRDYQLDLLNRILASSSMRNCVQLATGGGKTICFSHLANSNKGRVLILVNRFELLEQTAKNITRRKSLITAKTKKVGSGDVLIGMVESVFNRIKNGSFSLTGIDLIIVDEIQNLQFVKVFDGYEKRLIGFSATPVIMKKETYFKCKYCETKHKEITDCCGKETKKYNKKLSLKQWYGELILGVPISTLIDKNYLTDVHNFSCDTANLDKLITDGSGNFTAKSENEVFNNNASLENLVANYKEHSLGKKTMVFNSNIEANTQAVIKFKELGYDVRGYDSKSTTNRKDTVDWFKNTPNGVLMSVGVFTTGFDCEDVEVIIMNKATQSLSLYHQIIGRGGRITNKIYKPYFKFIDLGGNLSRFGSWSDNVNWESIYNDEKEKKVVECNLEDFQVCHNCFAMITEYDCEFCGAEKPPTKEKREFIKIAQEIKRLPLPKAEHILNYSLANDLDINEAKVLTANYFLDMFIFAKTPIERVRGNIKHLKREINKSILPIYFMLNNSSLKGNRKRTIADFERKIYNKLNKHYERK